MPVSVRIAPSIRIAPRVYRSPPKVTVPTYKPKLTDQYYLDPARPKVPFVYVPHSTTTGTVTQECDPIVKECKNKDAVGSVVAFVLLFFLIAFVAVFLLTRGR